MSNNRLTPEMLENAIVSTITRHIEGSKTTYCLLTLDNGFEVLGSSACVDKANFDLSTGIHWAQQDARKKAMDYLAFRLQEVLHAQREG